MNTIKIIRVNMIVKAKINNLNGKCLISFKI